MSRKKLKNGVFHKKVWLFLAIFDDFTNLSLTFVEILYHICAEMSMVINNKLKKFFILILYKINIFVLQFENIGRKLSFKSSQI